MFGGYSSVVERQPSKLNMRVRFPLPAPNEQEVVVGQWQVGGVLAENV